VHGALHTLHVSLNNSRTQTVHKWLRRIGGHPILTKFEYPWDIMSGEWRMNFFENFIQSQQQFLNRKSYQRRYLVHFSTGPGNKATWASETGWDNMWRRTVWAFAITQEKLRLWCLLALSIYFRQLLITSNKLPDQ